MMRPLKNRIIIDYKPENVYEREDGILIMGEDSTDFFELTALSAGLACKEVEDKDLILLRKESIYQVMVGLDWMYLTEENLVLKINGYPAGDKVIIKPETEIKTKNGIIIPDTATQNGVKRGVVLAVGADCTQVSVGQHVILDKYSGLEYEDELIVSESEILAICM